MGKKRIGEYLVSDKKISRQQLEHALQIQDRRSLVGTKPLLGALLLELWWIDDDDLDMALHEQAQEQTAQELQPA